MEGKMAEKPWKFSKWKNNGSPTNQHWIKENFWNSGWAQPYWSVKPAQIVLKLHLIRLLSTCLVQNASDLLLPMNVWFIPEQTDWLKLCLIFLNWLWWSHSNWRVVVEFHRFFMFILREREESVRWTQEAWTRPRVAGPGWIVLDSYLVDPASSHMLVSKIKPCMS